MEALLGGLLQNDDPRAQALLSELIGDNEIRDLLKQDLKAAAEQGSDGKIRKSWKLPEFPSVVGDSKLLKTDLQLTNTQKALWGVSHLDHPRALCHSGERHLNSAGSPGVDTNRLGGESDVEEVQPTSAKAPPNDGQFRNLRRRLNSDAASSLLGKSTAANASPSHLTISHTGQPIFNLERCYMSLFLFDSSQITYLRLPLLLRTPDDGQKASAANSHGATSSTSEISDVVGQLSINESTEICYHGRSSGLHLISKSHRHKDFFWHFPKPDAWPLVPTRQSRTDLDILNLTQPLDVLPSREMMYHLLDLYWTFVHPVMPVLHKTEFMSQFRKLIIHLDAREISNPGSDRNLNWLCSVNSLTLNEEEELQAGPRPSSTRTSPNHPPISILLLLVIFSLASRYSDLVSGPPVEGEYWDSGDRYLKKAKVFLNHDFSSSKLTTCQALILLAYREIGLGAMSESWQ